MDSADTAQEPYLESRGERVVEAGGEWTADRLHPLVPRVGRYSWPTGDFTFRAGRLQRVDSAGALLLLRILEQVEAAGGRIDRESFPEHLNTLLALFAGVEVPPKVPRRRRPGALEALGRSSVAGGIEQIHFLAFVGRLAAVAFPRLLLPWRLRWVFVWRTVADAGYRALPIVGLLGFLLGLVVAYQGGVQLRLYGAGVYIADLVGFSMLRELGPLITAVIVAGRTGSSFAAQIGTMQVTEEVDALRAMGIQPLEILVLPKIIGLFIAMPLLTLFANAMGSLGGFVAASALVGMSPATFLGRFAEAVPVSTYLFGIGKAPVFALIIGAVGCFQGFRVHGSAASVGHHTTMAVVHAIFLVIVVDAALSVVFTDLYGY